MKTSALVWDDVLEDVYEEEDVKPCISYRLWNVVAFWIPVSSIMWAGIIYAGFWLFR